mgnify:CR=1 FL=1
MRNASCIVDKALIDEILSKTCQIPKQMVENDETQRLGTLEGRLLSRIFGQNEAVSQVVNALVVGEGGVIHGLQQDIVDIRVGFLNFVQQKDGISQVVNAVKFARAGLLEEGKPLASLLFVFPP